MARLTDIDKTAPRTAPLIIVGKNTCTLNKHAMRLLGVNDACSVRFRTDSRNRYVYVSVTQRMDGYAVVRKQNRGMINSRSLTTALSAMLQGYGTYRICEEDTIKDDMDGTTCYAIFFKKY